MNKIKTLGTLAGVLAVINICLVIFLIMGRPKGPHPGPMGKENAEHFIKDKFQFDDAQMKAFQISKEKHMESSRAVQKELEVLSRSYYMTDGAGDVSVRDSLMTQINILSSEMYEINRMHFDEVKGICNPDQVAEMEGFINGLLMPKRKRDK